MCMAPSCRLAGAIREPGRDRNRKIMLTCRLPGLVLKWLSLLSGINILRCTALHRPSFDQAMNKESVECGSGWMLRCFHCSQRFQRNDLATMHGVLCVPRTSELLPARIQGIAMNRLAALLHFHVLPPGRWRAAHLGLTPILAGNR